MSYRSLKSSHNSLCSLLIVDTPGFQNPRLMRRECGATFDDLCHNYTQERLQDLFYQRTFVEELERHKDVRRIDILSISLSLFRPCVHLTFFHINDSISPSLPQIYASTLFVLLIHQYTTVVFLSSSGEHRDCFRGHRTQHVSVSASDRPSLKSGTGKISATFVDLISSTLTVM